MSRSSSSQDEPEAPTSGDPEASLETVAKRRRRVFSAADKLRILKKPTSASLAANETLWGRSCAVGIP